MSTRGARTFFSVQIAEIESPCARTCVFLSLFERVANIYRNSRGRSDRSAQGLLFISHFVKIIYLFLGRARARDVSDLI